MTNLAFLGLLFIVGLLPYSLGHIVLGETNGFYNEVVDHIAAWCMGLCLVFMVWLVFTTIVLHPLPDGLNIVEMVQLFFDSISMVFGFVGISIAVTVLDQVRSSRKRKEKSRRRKMRDMANRANKPKVVKRPVKPMGEERVLQMLDELDLLLHKKPMERLIRCIDV